jgi:hypothetical protein
MTKKYELLEKDKENPLHRIRALRDIPRYGVKAGDIGGFVESEENLDQECDAWVGGNAFIFDDAMVYGKSIVYGNAKVYGNTHIYGYAQVYGYAWVYGYARVYGEARVYGDAMVYDSAEVYGNVDVLGGVRIYEKARISSEAQVYGYARICGNAEIKGTRDWLCVGPIGSRNGFTTFFRSADGGVEVRCGCRLAPLDEFERAVENDHGEDAHGVEYRAAIALAKARFEAQKEPSHS